MPQATRPDRMRGRISLPVRLSLLILFAALVPLAAVVGINTYRARQALTDQGQARLSSDASAKAALIDSYMYERMLDGQALVALPTAQDYLACAQRSALVASLPSAMAPYLPLLTAVMRCNDPYYNLASSQRALAIGVVRDSNYAGWTIFDAGLNPLLTNSSNTPVVSAADANALKQGHQYISDVHYAPGQGQALGHAYLYVYTPVSLVLSDLALQVSYAAQSGQLPLSQSQVAQLTGALKALPNPTVGFLRSTLNLDYIWGIVGHEQGANGDGSNAFLTDQNGIRFASSTSSELFTAVSQLDPTTLKAIQSEKRFGSDTAPPVVDLPDVATSLGNGDAQQSFQSVASPGSQTQYQFERIKLNKISIDRTDANGKPVAMPLGWSYFVLSPTATVTQIATDQVYYSLLSAAVVAVLAILIGLFMGSRMTKPVQRSVAELEGAAVRLHSLASRQQHSSGEQHWVVDACQTGLESVRYLSDAMHQAAKRVTEASNWFGDYWDRLTEEQARRTVQHLQELAHYIEEAARRQQASSDRLGKAITVTRQVSDQLVSGAAAATESADQLELVVRDLHSVVGGPARQLTSPETGDMPLEELPGGMPQNGSAYPPDPMYGPDPRQPVGARVPRNGPSGWGEYDPGMGAGAYNGNGASGYGGPNSGFGGYSGPNSGFGGPNSGFGGQNSGYGGQNSGYGGQNSGRGPRLPNPPSVWGPQGGWGER